MKKIIQRLETEICIEELVTNSKRDALTQLKNGRILIPLKTLQKSNHICEKAIDVLTTKHRPYLLDNKFCFKLREINGVLGSIGQGPIVIDMNCLEELSDTTTLEIAKIF